MAQYNLTPIRDLTRQSNVEYLLTTQKGATQTAVSSGSVPATSNLQVLYNTELNIPRQATWGTPTMSASVNITTANANMTVQAAIKDLATGTTTALGTAVSCGTTGVKSLTIPATAFAGTAVGDRIQLILQFNNTAASAQSCSYAVGDATSFLTSGITEFSDQPGVVIPSAQYASDELTPVPIGSAGINTDGRTTPIYLEQDVLSYGLSYNLTPNFEVQQVGTALTNTANANGLQQKLRADTLITARRGATMTYDSLNKRYLTIGGYDGVTRYNDLYQIDASQILGRWKKLAPTGTPPVGKNLSSSVQLNANGKSWLVSWGGSGTAGADTGDLLICDCTTPGSEVWTTVTQTGGPAVRSYVTHHMAVRQISNTKFELYLFGGWGALRVNDLDKVTIDLGGAVPTALTWTVVTANGAGGSPSIRSGVFMCYDKRNDRLILTCGFDGTTYLQDVWHYPFSGAGANAWAQLTTSGDAITGRELPSGGWDEANQRIILFGGWVGAITNDRNDIIEINFNSRDKPVVKVVKTNDTANQDSYCFSSGAACVDTDENLIVEFGQNGYDTTDKYINVIDMSPKALVPTYYGLNVTDHFRGRDAPLSVYDSNKSLFALIAGYSGVEDDTTVNIPKGDHHNDIWTYDLANNKLRYANKGFYGMPYKEGIAGAFDTTLNRILAFGGLSGNGRTSNEVWALTPDTYGNYQATLLRPTGTRPASRWLSIAAYDANRKRLVVWGGEDATTVYSDFWVLDFSTDPNGVWSSVTPSGTVPTAVWQPGYAYDATNNKLYAHGGATNQAGTTFSAQTFYIDLSTATPSYTILTPTGGTAYRGLALGVDVTNNKLIAFGGFDGTSVFQTIRSLDLASPTAWTTATPTGSPLGRRSSGYAFFGGKFYISCGREAAGQFFNDVWELTPNYTTLSSSTWVNKTPDVYQRVATTIINQIPASYHWQSWITDVTTAVASAKVSFGANLESVADFIINAADQFSYMAQRVINMRGGSMAMRRLSRMRRPPQGYVVGATGPQNYQSPLSGALAFTGSNVKANTKGLTAATLAFVGSIAKRVPKILAGVLSFTASINTLRNVLLSGALSFTGAINRSTKRTLSAALGFLGNVAKSSTRSLASVLSFTGAFNSSKTFLRAFAGVLGFTGSFAKTPNKSLLAAVGFTGSISRRDVKNLTAALGFTGSIIKSIPKTLAGALSFTGSISRAIPKLLTGTLSFTGNISRSIPKVLAGVLGFTGSIAKRSTRSLTAALGFTGNITKAVARSLSAALSFAGAIATNLISGAIHNFLSLAGALGFTGKVNQQTTHPLSASVGFVGSFIKTSTRTLSASLAFVGTLPRSARKTMAAAVSFTGNVSRAIPKALTAVLSFTGSISKTIPKLLTSTLSFVGSISRSVPKLLSASLSFTGLIGKSFPKLLTGALGFTGNVSKSAGKSLAATLGFAGSIGKSISKGVAAILSFTGGFASSLNHIGNNFFQSLSGGLSFTGNISRNNFKLIPAALSFVGTVNMNTRRAFTATMAFVGSFSKTAGKSLAASLGFTGALKRSFVKTLAATLAFTGNINNAIKTGLPAALSFTGAIAKTTSRKLVAATLGFTGTFFKQGTRTFTASVAFVGSIPKKVTGKALPAALSFTASLGNAIKTRLISTLSFTGNVVKTSTRKFTAAVGFTGTFVRGLILFRTFTGALSFTGSIPKKTTGKALPASLSFVGNINNLIRTNLTASLSFIGVMLMKVPSVFRPIGVILSSFRNSGAQESHTNVADVAGGGTISDVSSASRTGDIASQPNSGIIESKTNEGNVG